MATRIAAKRLFCSGKVVKTSGLTVHPSTSARFYSWSTNSKSDAPPLYRSKTAYDDILCVNPNATQSQIKTASYKQALIYHPDKTHGSEEATQRFAEISDAYTVQGNKILRMKYDGGIMSQSDLQGAGRPSNKETSKPQQQHASRRFSKFDFDAFTQAHYGEQLRKERQMKSRMKKRQEDFKIDMTVVLLMAMAGVIFFSC